MCSEVSSVLRNGVSRGSRFLSSKVSGAATSSSSGALVWRRPPGPDFDFALLDSQVDSQSALGDTESWEGLREAANWALSQGKLDTYLWWRYAADGRLRLRKGTVPPEDVRNALGLVSACARARVEPQTGIYSAWVRTLRRTTVETMDIVAETALALARSKAHLDDERFWFEWLPNALLMTSCTAGRDLAVIAAAYAEAGLTCDTALSTVAQLVIGLDTQPETPALQPGDAALMLWAQRRCGHLSWRLLRHLWDSCLRSRVPQLSNAQLVAVVDAASALQADGEIRRELLKVLQHRVSTSPHTADFPVLSRAVLTLSAVGLVFPNELWALGEAATVGWKALTHAPASWLLCAFARLHVLDWPLLTVLASKVTAWIEKGGHSDNVRYDGNAVVSVLPETPVITDFNRLGHVADESLTSFDALEGVCRLSVVQKKPPPDVWPADLELRLVALAVSASSPNTNLKLPTTRVVSLVLALLECGRIPVANTLFDNLRVSSLVGSLPRDVADLEALARIMCVLPSPSVDVRSVAHLLSEGAREGRLSPTLAVSASLSLALLGLNPNKEIRASLEPVLAFVQAAGVMELCLVVLLNASTDGARACAAADWKLMMKLVTTLGAPDSLRGAERLLLQLIERLHDRIDATKLQWPLSLHLSSGSSPANAQHVDDHLLAHPNATVRLHSCVHVLVGRNFTDTYAASVPAANTIGRLQHWLQSVLD